jgi:sensory rhodopsin
MEQIIILIGIILFSISSLYFAFTRKTSTTLNSAFLVSLITVVSHVVFLDGQFTGATPDGDILYYTRWIGYGFSCTLLAYAMAQKLRLTGPKKIDLLYMMATTMVTGALASITSGITMLLLFTVGGITFIRAIKILRSGDRQVFKSIAPFLWLGWSVFPIIFILSPEGYGIMSVAASMVIYLLLDIYTKIVFYFNQSMK